MCDSRFQARKIRLTETKHLVRRQHVLIRRGAFFPSIFILLDKILAPCSNGIFPGRFAGGTSTKHRVFSLERGTHKEHNRFSCDSVPLVRHILSSKAPRHYVAHPGSSAGVTGFSHSIKTATHPQVATVDAMQTGFGRAERHQNSPIGVDR
jgi:hypothetical protein